MESATLTLGLTAVGILAALTGLLALATRLRLPRITAAAAIIAGAALAVLPWLPRGPAPPTDQPITVAPVTLSPDGRRTQVAAPPGPLPPLPGREALPIPIEATEAEPNDTLAGANRARPGITIDGTLGAEDRDWFAIDVSPHRRARIVASLVTTDASVTMTLFDDSGQPLGSARTIDEISVRTATLERAATRPRFYILLLPASGAPARYQLIVTTRRW